MWLLMPRCYSTGASAPTILASPWLNETGLKNKWLLLIWKQYKAEIHFDDEITRFVICISAHKVSLIYIFQVNSVQWPWPNLLRDCYLIAMKFMDFLYIYSAHVFVGTHFSQYTGLDLSHKKNLLAVIHVHAALGNSVVYRPSFNCVLNYSIHHSSFIQNIDTNTERLFHMNISQLYDLSTPVFNCNKSCRHECYIFISSSSLRCMVLQTYNNSTTFMMDENWTHFFIFYWKLNQFV